MFGTLWGWVNDDRTITFSSDCRHASNSHKSLWLLPVTDRTLYVMQRLLRFWSTPSSLLEYCANMTHRLCAITPQEVYEDDCALNNGLGSPPTTGTQHWKTKHWRCGRCYCAGGQASVMLEICALGSESIVSTAAGMWTTRDAVFIEICHFLWGSVDALLNEILSTLNPWHSPAVCEGLEEPWRM